MCVCLPALLPVFPGLCPQPVVYEFYDEVVFTNPSREFYDTMIQGPMLELAPTGSHLDPVLDSSPAKPLVLLLIDHVLSLPAVPGTLHRVQ